MMPEIANRMVLVTLPAIFVDALIKMRRALDDDTITSLEEGLFINPTPPVSRSRQEPVGVTPQQSAKYAAEFLGVRFAAKTLPEVFARIVDMTSEVAPEALDKLANVTARKRRFVARDPEAIHPGSRYLPVMQTDSGWWISKNTGLADLKRSLRALCQTTGLVFGTDVKFG